MGAKFQLKKIDIQRQKQRIEIIRISNLVNSTDTGP